MVPDLRPAYQTKTFPLIRLKSNEAEIALRLILFTYVNPYWGISVVDKVLLRRY